MAINHKKIDRVAAAICFAASYCLDENKKCLHCESKGDSCTMIEQFRIEALAAIGELKK